MLRALNRVGVLASRATASVHCSARDLSLRSHLDSHDGGKVYEMRTYAVFPGRLRDAVQLIGDNIHVRTAHSKLLGIWTTEMGGMNELIHLWEYDNYDHRTAVRKAVGEDNDWNDNCLTKLLPMLASQTNCILSSFPWYSPQLKPHNHGVYELVTHTLKPGTISQWEHILLRGLPARLRLQYPPPLAFFYSDFGQISTVYHLWPHESFQKRAEHRQGELFGDKEWKETFSGSMPFIQSMQVKALIPTLFSPLK